MNQVNHKNNMFKCILETPSEEIMIGYGLSPDEAFQKCMDNLHIARTPKKGPGMWEEAIRNTTDK